MTWSTHTHNMACINSLARAKTFWAEQPVWKGQHHSFKPLDSVRMPHKRIVKLDGDEGYELTLYNTPMVTYYASGNIALRCHDTISSGAFAWKVRPHGCEPTSQSGKMYWQVDTPDGDRFYRQGEEPLLLEPTDDGPHTWQLTNEPLFEKEWRYDPKLGAQARKIIKPYCQWHKAVTRLIGTMPHSSAWPGPRKTAFHDLWADPGNVELYPRHAEVLGYPDQVREQAYLMLGARYKVNAPHDRLPRKTS